jgi:hypothetical protein
MFGSLINPILGSGSVPGGSKKGTFLPEPPVTPPSPRPPVRPPEPGCSTLPVTPAPEVPSVKKAQRVSKR